MKSKKKIEIIAEIANAHQGNYKLAIRIAKEAFFANADAVKFQVYFADEFLVKSHSRYQHFKKQSFSPKIWKLIFNEVRKYKIKIYCDVFGVKAFNLANKYKLDGVKIHSSDLNNQHLLAKCKRYNKKIFLAAGGSTIEEINYALNYLDSKKNKPILLHGFQNYPTSVDDTCLSRINFFKNIFKERCEYGYQDHISGSSQFSDILPVLSMNYDIGYIEKHITIDRLKKGVDYYSSIEPKKFKSFVNIIRKCENNKNSNPLIFKKSEEIYRNQVKKYWVSSKSLKKGKVVKQDDIIMKRCDDSSLNVLAFKDIINKKLIRSIAKEEPIKKNMFKNKICATILVRSQSKRLKNKAYLKIENLSLIEHLINKVKRIASIDEIILCTTKNKSDDNLVRIAKKNKISYYRGPIKNVLGRIIGATKNKKCDLVLRITGDDILVDPYHAEIAIKHHLLTNSEYTDHKKLPGGTEIEIFDYSILNKLNKSIIAKDDTEYLTNFIVDNKSQFKTSSAPVSKKFLTNDNFTIDTFQDYKKVKKFLEKMAKLNKLFSYSLDDIINFYGKKKFSINAENFSKSKLKINTQIKWEIFKSL